jgi:ATP-binding cassette subfamily B protein
MNSNFSSFRRLLSYMLPYRSKIIAATSCSILQNIFDVFPEVLIGITIDVLVNRQNSFLAYWGVVDVLPSVV